VLGETGGPLFIEVLVRKGNRKDLGRPRSSPQENKEAFMRFVSAIKTADTNTIDDIKTSSIAGVCGHPFGTSQTPISEEGVT
jgi:hypothetical protein